jgi:FkbM family methyltransferase
LPQFAGGYEPETQLLVQILVGTEGEFFDVGANWGHLSIGLAAARGYSGEIHAFEPSASAFQDLCNVTQQLHIVRIVGHQLALGNETGGAMLRSPDGVHSGLARIVPNIGESVTIARLDDLGLPAPTVIKLDLEGGELRALQGAEATLHACKPYVILETWHADDESVTALRFLEDRGYRLYEPLLVSALEAQETFPYGRALPSNQLVRLALRPFTAASRCGLGEHFNALACPMTRLEDLQEKLAAGSVARAMEA